jgi:hypothetical protein
MLGKTASILSIVWGGGQPPEKENTSSTPACCTCQLVKGEEAHSANYYGCRYTKEEMQKRKSQGKTKTTTQKVFSTNIATPDVSFVAMLRGIRASDMLGGNGRSCHNGTEGLCSLTPT